MDDATHALSRPRIDVTDDGSRLRPNVVDDRGGSASVSLPVSCLNLVVTAVPQVFEGLSMPPAYEVESWSLEQGEDGLALTLRQPDSAAIAFAM